MSTVKTASRKVAWCRYEEPHWVAWVGAITLRMAPESEWWWYRGHARNLGNEEPRMQPQRRLWGIYVRSSLLGVVSFPYNRPRRTHP